MAKKGENIYKRKDGRWEGRYPTGRNAGKRIIYRSIYGKSYKEVKQKLLAKKAEYPNWDCYQKTDIYANEWLAYKKDKVRRSTMEKYHNIIYTHIVPFFGIKDICAINSNDIMEFYVHLESYKNPKGVVGLSDKTMYDIACVLKNVFRYAALLTNTTNISSTGCFPLPKVKRKNIDVYTLQEERNLCNYLLAKPSDLNIGILICLCTGIRLGEVCALKWKDIHLPEEYIDISKTMQRVSITAPCDRKTEVIITEPKSASSKRKIPISVFLNEIFTAYQKSNDAYILTGRADKYMEPRTLQNHFKKITASLNLPSYNFHVLRHTFASHCVEAGCDIKSLSEILGHANVNITLNKYVHPSMDTKKININLFTDYLLAVV